MVNQQEEFAWWREELAGADPPVERGRVYSGYYWRRVRNGDVIGVAVWRDHHGRLTCKAGLGDSFVVLDEEEFAELQFSWFCHQPVSYEDYTMWLRDGVWGTMPEAKPKPKAPKRERIRRVVTDPEAFCGYLLQQNHSMLMDCLKAAAGRFSPALGDIPGTEVKRP